MALTDSIISYWKLDGNSNDATASANNGTGLNVTYSSGNGKINEGAGFAGTGNITFTNNSGLKPSSFTVNLWMKTTDTTDQSLMENFNESGGPLSGWRFWMSGTLLALDLGNDTGTTLGTNYGRVTSSPSGLNDGTFKMLTARFDDATDTLEIFLNGSSLNSYSSYTGGIVYDASTAFIIADGTLGKFANGALDEIGYWSRALSNAEITQLYNAGAGLAYPFSSGSPISNLLLMGV